MKTENTIFTIVLMMACLLLASCTAGMGDTRDRNLEQVVQTQLDSIPEVEYVGMSDVRSLEGDRLHAVVIYYAADSAGNRVERNARVTTNNDCSELYSWEELDTQVLSDVRHMVADKMEENGIDMDGSLIDALIKLKRK